MGIAQRFFYLIAIVILSKPVGRVEWISVLSLPKDLKGILRFRFRSTQNDKVKQHTSVILSKPVGRVERISKEILSSLSLLRMTKGDFLFIPL